MVTFWNLILPHVLDIQVTKTRLTLERDVPYRTVAYRSDDRDLGQTILIRGEIRESNIVMAASKMSTIETLNDGVVRSLDLADGTTPVMNAMLVDPHFTLQVGYWFNESRCYVPYSVTFLEVA